MDNISEFIRTKSKGRYDQIAEMPHEEGGFGRLYRARDTKHPQIEACIKVIKPNLSKDLQFKLWNDEVTALGRYRNRSGIVHLVDEQYHFSKNDPYVFIVMDYVHGKRLGASKYQIELDVEEDLAILLIFQLCSVIFSIHQRGEYHQDIFPDNIKVQDHDLILLDLGGMREAERRSGTIIFGGEMYSPPEVSPTRLRMKRFRTLRKRKMGSFESADIFSIGAIFYELIMGVQFFDGMEQSNQLKEYVYDYYTDPDILNRMKRDYSEAIRAVKRNRENFYNYLLQYQIPMELCKCLEATLSLHPPKRPSIEELLHQFFPYMLQRASEYYFQSDWEQAQLWVRYLGRHFDEVRLESQDEDVLFRQKMEQHLLMCFPFYIQGCLITGSSLFYQGRFDAAQQLFLKTQDILEHFETHHSGPQWNVSLLKIMNNLAACHYKLKRNEEAIHLFKTLSTAGGKFGQIISHNLQICATEKVKSDRS
jgi:serine/threonine protein kinase